MSIYSGFATRFQEEAYDHCIDSLLYILQKRIIKFYQGEPADEEKFISLVLKLNQQLRTMEKNKYLEPKSSQSVNELIQYMQLFQHNLTHPQEDNRQDLPSITPPEQAPPSKNPFWVERKPAAHESERKKSEEGNVGLVGVGKGDGRGKEQGGTEFRKTGYNSGAGLKGVKMKHGASPSGHPPHPYDSALPSSSTRRKDRAMSGYHL